MWQMSDLYRAKDYTVNMKAIIATVTINSFRFTVYTRSCWKWNKNSYACAVLSQTYTNTLNHYSETQIKMKLMQIHIVICRHVFVVVLVRISVWCWSRFSRTFPNNDYFIERALSLSSFSFFLTVYV